MVPGRKPSLKPALVVVGLAVFVVLGGIVLSFATGGWTASAGGTGATGVTGGAPPATHLAGTTIAAVSAAGDLAVIASDGQPPADIRDTLVVPAGARLTGHEDIDDDLGPFDRAVYLSVDALPAQVVSFFRVALERQGWGLLPGGVTSGNDTEEQIFEKAGSDGYYWQVAVTVTTVAAPLTPAIAGGAQTAPTSRVELELVQVEDAD